MVKLRLARRGNHKRPFYRVVVAEDSSPRDGRFIEIVGTYDPLTKPAAIEVDADAVLKWLSQGAQPTDTVRRILAKTGVWAHWRSVQRGEVKLEEMSGRLSGTVERDRTAQPSKKAAAKIQEAEKEKEKEKEKAAEEAKAEAEAPAAEEKVEEKEAPAPDEKPAEAKEESGN